MKETNEQKRDRLAKIAAAVFYHEPFPFLVSREWDSLEEGTRENFRSIVDFVLRYADQKENTPT